MATEANIHSGGDNFSSEQISTGAILYRQGRIRILQLNSVSVSIGSAGINIAAADRPANSCLNLVNMYRLSGSPSYSSGYAGISSSNGSMFVYEYSGGTVVPPTCNIEGVLIWTV